MSSSFEDSFPVVRAFDISEPRIERAWLVDELWGASAVGIIGGQPKCCKSWLALEIAVSVATGSRCLGRYEIREPGPALVYLAEDAIESVRRRLDALARHHATPLETLDVRIITEPSIRLDLARDRLRLEKTVRDHRPRVLILDPLVRLHRLDENSAQEVSGLLSYLRDLQRTLDLAIILVHHTRKNSTPAQLGLGLRGSGDFHAWSDSSLYLRRSQSHILLTVEHRSAPAPEPLALRLVTDAQSVHLDIVAAPASPASPRTLETPILEALADRALTRSALREILAVKNERLGPALAALEQNGFIQRADGGWRRTERRVDSIEMREPESA